MTPPEIEESDGEEVETPQDGPEKPEAELLPPPRGHKQRIIKAKRAELEEWVLAQAERLGEPRQVVLRGEGIGRLSAELDKVASALGSLASMLKEVGVDPRLGGDGLSFANSIHVDLRPSEDELKRAETALIEAAELEREIRERPKVAKDKGRDDVEKVIHQLRRQAVPDLDVALAVAGDLIEAPVDEAPFRAAELGTNAAAAYKSLATAIAKGGLALELPYVHVEDSEPQERTVVFGYGKAQRVADALREPSEPKSAIVEIKGKLSLADASKMLFGLDLDPKSPKPEILKRKRVIRGRYTAEVEELIVSGGLWNTWVVAEVEVESDALISTSSIRAPSYRLVGVSPADVA